VKLLLDTHIVLWTVLGKPELTRATRKLMQDADSVFVSSISLWEVAIKAAQGKLPVDMQRLRADLQASTFLPLPVTWEHALTLRGLPLLHRDPFDRMLIAQAMSEPMHLVTHDAKLAAYSPLVMVV
jgi:PIN domain nuclease of toxin-antitoxin system